MEGKELAQEYTFGAATEVPAEVSQTDPNQVPALGDPTMNSQDVMTQLSQIPGFDDIMNQLNGNPAPVDPTSNPQDVATQLSQIPGFDDIMNQLNSIPGLEQQPGPIETPDLGQPPVDQQPVDQQPIDQQPMDDLPPDDIYSPGSDGGWGDGAAGDAGETFGDIGAAIGDAFDGF
jgi:hypothetical protein